MADENELDRLAGLRPPRPSHPTCIETTPLSGVEAWVCGPGCPRPAGPDPARDARVDAYRDRERRRAARALDRYVEAMWGDGEWRPGGPLPSRVVEAAGERFVELVGDYVLARLGERFDSSGDPMCEQTGCQGGRHVAPCVYADTERD